MKKKKILPRHSAGSMELKEGTGPIIAMCQCGEFLEIYKVDKTFRVQTPECIDPDETNPNAPWIVTPVDDIGSSNQIISRVLLQGHDILKSAMFEKNIDIEAVTKTLHNCKESLVSCYKIANRIASNVANVIKKVSTDGISTDNNGRSLNPFPHVPELETECATYLVHANRAIKSICELPGLFLDLDKVDSNFDSLAMRLRRVLGEDAHLSKFVRDNAGGVRYLIDLRNFHEHPKEQRTIIENFRLMPDMKIQMPMWYVTGNDPRPISVEMEAAINFLVELAEAMLIHLVLTSVVKTFPFIIERVEESKIDPKNPIIYRLSIDITKMKIK
jgi:hypothetical protein